MSYVKDIFRSMGSMLSGMQITGHYFLNFRKALTEEYPENRETLKLSPRFKGELVLKHSIGNMHKCTGCSACEIACPKCLNFKQQSMLSIQNDLVIDMSSPGK